MSKGPGAVEKRIADLFAATRDHALSIDEITDNAYVLEGKKPTRAQRLAATRAAHRLVRRIREASERADKLINGAHPADPAFIEGIRLREVFSRIGIWSRTVLVEGKPGWLREEHDFWSATTFRGRLWFHPPDVPVRAWAITIDGRGVHWFEAEVTKVTERNVVVHYAGETARLDRRKLWRWWAWWRGVRFVSSRTGRIASELDKIWWERFGTAGVPPRAMQMPLVEAIALLGVPADYIRDDVIAAFRRKAKEAHPDVGGTAEMFRKLVEARDRLLAAIGTSAPPPKQPTYAPKGVAVVYRVVRRASNRQRLGSSTKLVTSRRA